MDSVVLLPRPTTKQRGIRRARVLLCPTWFFGCQITDPVCGYWNLLVCVIPFIGIEFTVMKRGFRRYR